ncbi:MAG TPA: efflux RND transporter periplasmic adaptor subunit [Dehalococcoidales bacterium]|nr:efflux RND transporter periplasmic adaptor subunit [Dehalococcoidales bacterium]
MKRKFITGLMLALALAALAGLTACQSGGGGDTISRQLVTVTRGDVAVSVTGSGKIETSREARLSFGSGGKVETIKVEEGDKVMAGDVLAGLDTTPLELAMNQAQMTVTQAEVSLTQARLAEATAGYNLKNTRESEEALELALLNAEIARDTAQNALEAGITAVNFEAVRAELDKARAWYDYVKRMTQEVVGASLDDWLVALDNAQDRVKAAQANYDSTLAGYDSRQTNLRKKQLEAAKLGVDQARSNIDGLADDIALQELQVMSAGQTVRQAEQAVDLARKSLADARRQFDEAVITAPFDGVVAAVMAREGDMVPAPTFAPTTIVRMISPGHLELVIQVDEIDIPLVVQGQEAAIEVDALPDKKFTGAVTAVYPVPVEVGGVVLYQVRVGLEAPADSGIKIGMSASATIVAQQRKNVLVVPSRAVTRDAEGQTIVRVMVNEQVQERPVTVGLDDGRQAEIVNGVSEGETVVVEVRIKTPSTSFF